MVCRVELLAVSLLLLLSLAVAEEHINIKDNLLGPPLPHRPFVVAWDVASNRCEEKFGVRLDLSDFDIVYNENKGWRGSSLVIFYADQLGYYPRFDTTNHNRPINGGLPQEVDLVSHLEKAKQDILNFIPDPDFRGLAVIDWESWHPLWNRMTWGNLVIYRNKSIEKVKTEHPDWSPQRVVAVAKSEYEAAARTFMSFTLSLAKILRPNALWGLYLYPDCYNYHKDGTDLKCTNATLYMNDEIQWLFDHSSALYPSVYLGEWYKNNQTARDYVAYRILEAGRVDSDRPGHVSVPIFAYHLITYRKVPGFVELYDLRDSIGVAALLGASGMVIWGDYNLANSEEECKNLSKYLSTTLGPYVKATSDAASKCSLENCSGNGRCVLTPFPTEGYSTRYLDIYEAGKIIMNLQNDAYKVFDSSFLNRAFESRYEIFCQCYKNWRGKDCSVSH